MLEAVTFDYRDTLVHEEHRAMRRGAIGGLATAARRGRASHRPAGLPALERLEVADPSRAAHVGDNRRTDVSGALGLGMTAVRYTGIADRPTNGSRRPRT